ncbi:hypothetical protein BJV82DRAFT_577236 [Fennellomyces sp. T-0311]|nr:hypothetical protein BJV82DRAFT_577236 [Fennellomyces sp. T-0311]
MEPTVFPFILYTRKLGSFLAVIQSLHNSIGKKNYREVVLYTTTAIDQMKPSLLLQAFLDVRAHAYFALGKANAALEDAQRMVDCAPTSAVGYLRKGHYLSLYGQHKRSAEIYEQGLLNAQADREEMDLLAKGKSAETYLSARKVDFIAALPVEVTMQIIPQLPQATVATCLTVSSTWRQRTLNCENVWTDLSVKEDLTSAPFINVTPYMDCHVKHLTLNVASDVANAVCMQKLREGHFTKLVSLKITAPMSQLGGDFSLLDNDHTLTNLELTASSITGATIGHMTLAYNPDFKISSLRKFNRHQSGLRKIYTNNGGTRVDAMSVLPLIYQNRATLESIYVNITALTNTELQQLYTNYPDFTFPKVYDFTFCLISLLERYARLSSSHSQVLESIILRSVDEVTDKILDVLGDVKTVNQVNFEDLKHITAEGITRFIEKRRSNLMYIKLSGIEAITDNIVVALGSLKKLGAVNLTEFQNVTDRGVRGLINGPRFRVSRFTIKDCHSITEECINYAKRKIKYVADE